MSAALAAARDHPGFMAHAYTCDGKQVPLMKAVCNPYVRILRFQDDRSPTSSATGCPAPTW